MVTPAQVVTQWTGTVNYPGVFFVQSAGNDNADVCTHTGAAFGGQAAAAFTIVPYANATSVDGIMVVGAIQQNGAHATSFVPAEPRILPGSAGGSNWGNCVDIWAPGDFIYSTWGQNLSSTFGNLTYSGGQTSAFTPGLTPPASPPPNSVSGWQWLSGTSMAAPHVAAAAAYVADLYGLTTPFAIESAIRQSHRAYYGFKDPNAFTADPEAGKIYVVKLP